MKSLIRNKLVTPPRASSQVRPAEPMVAQCCAKVSKAVAGCHD